MEDIKPYFDHPSLAHGLSLLYQSRSIHFCCFISSPHSVFYAICQKVPYLNINTSDAVTASSFKHGAWIVLLTLFAQAIGCTTSVLLSAGTIIALDNATSSLEVLRNSPLLVENDRISQVFKGSSSTMTMPSGIELLNISRKIVTLALLTCTRRSSRPLNPTTASQHTSLCSERQAPAENLFTAEDSYLSQRVGGLESLNAGVTAILDHAHSLWSNDTADAILNGNIDSGCSGRLCVCYSPANQ